VATRYAQCQSVLSLLEAGAEPQIQDKVGIFDGWDIFADLISFKHGETSLHIAAWDGQNGLLDLLCRFSQEMNNSNLVSPQKKGQNK
jgi:hypothetical protein